MGHIVGKLADVSPDLGPFDGHAEGLTRRPLWDRSNGAVHHSLVHKELAGGINAHRHAFEQAIYVLSGSLAVALAGSREQLGPEDTLWIELGVVHEL